VSRRPALRVVTDEGARAPASTLGRAILNPSHPAHSISVNPSFRRSRGPNTPEPSIRSNALTYSVRSRDTAMPWVSR
jgi:hypothetical protein